MSEMTNGPVVTTGRGAVRGVRQGRVACFRGIPYAASPVGGLRFSPPRPHPGWQDVRDAARSGPSVPQGPSRLERVMGRRTPDWDEDGCLTLNVWAPSQAPGEQAGLPVLVWFHGGGFTSGSGGWDWYDGARLAEAGNMVVVTANYRLGPLGYLCLPRIGADNCGSRDQAAVLRWVCENIASFGGDPGALTVGGQSAGAFSALALALDPETSGLVRRVLLESLPADLEPQSPQLAARIAERYLSLLGLAAAPGSGPGPGSDSGSDSGSDYGPGPDSDSGSDSGSGSGAGEALRRLPVGRLLDAYGRLAGELAAAGGVAPPMYPVLGGAGCPRTFAQALAEGALRGKELLIGTAREEMTAFLVLDERVRSFTHDEARAFLTSAFGEGALGAYERHLAGLPHARPASVLAAVETDAVFREGALRIAGRHASGGDSTYVYRFDHRPAAGDAALGASHCVELPFLFGTFEAYSDSPMLGEADATDRALGRELASAVAEFVTKGAPSAWPPYLPDGAAASVRHFG